MVLKKRNPQKHQNRGEKSLNKKRFGLVLVLLFLIFFFNQIKKKKIKDLPIMLILGTEKNFDLKARRLDIGVPLLTIKIALSLVSRVYVEGGE